MDILIRLVPNGNRPVDSQNIPDCSALFIESRDIQFWISTGLESGYDMMLCDFFPVVTSDVLHGVFLRHRGTSPLAVIGKLPLRANVLWMDNANAAATSDSRQLWIPCHAVMTPQPREFDWRELMAGHADIIVWHPAYGLLEFDESQRMGVESLITASEIASQDWSKAMEGTGIPERLLRVDSPPPPTLQQWLDESGKQLGKPPKPLMNLPPSQAEKRGRPIRNMWNQARAVFGKAVHRIFDDSANTRSKNTLPGRKSGKSSALSNSQWVKNIRLWAANQMQQWNETLEARRHASVNRLMEMLEKDPEQGLRYAIPMGETGLGRGLSRPGADLVERDWSISGNSGGSDYWSLSSSLQIRLRARYLELAQREAANGRYERAAFIYAQLLGDFAGAANVLEQGKFYRQAALIYRDRLSHKRKAAELFRLVGDFDETLVLYKSMGMHSQAGDLYQVLGQQEKANQCFLDYVEECCSQSRWCDAADVLTSKLRQVDQAIHLLQSHWPHSNQARKCLEKTISILHEFDRSNECAAQIDRLLGAPQLLDCGSWPADFLADMVQSQKGSNFTEHARQSLYRLSSRMLNSELHASHHNAIGTALRKAVPEDRLFHRDTMTFVEQTEKNRNTVPPRAIVHRPKQLQSELSLTLANETEWFGAILTHRGPLCFGDRDGTLFIQPAWQEKPVARGSEGKSTQGSFEIRSFFGEQRRWMSYSGGMHKGIESYTVVIPGKQSPQEFDEGSSYWYDGLLNFQIVPCNHSILDCCVKAGSSPQSLENPLQHSFFLQKIGMGIRLGLRDNISRTLSPPDILMRDFRNLFDQSEYSDIADPAVDDELLDQLVSEYLSNLPWRIALHSNEALVACGTRMHIYQQWQSLMHEVDLPNPIETITVPSSSAPGRAILGMTTGVALQWLGVRQYRYQMIDELATHARSCFLSTGQLAIAHDGGIDVYGQCLDHAKLELSCRGDRNYAAIIADDEGGFWTLTQQGLVQYWHQNSNGP